MMEGHVEITLAGDSITLAPTLGCALELCRKHGSLGAVLDKLEAYDLNAATDVVQAGLGFLKREVVAQQVYDAGLVDLTPALVRFVIMLANGGKPMKAEEEEKPGGPFAG